MINYKNLLLATIECWVLPGIVNVGNALAVPSSEFAIANSSQVTFLTKGQVAPLPNFIIVERVAILISTALIKAVKSSSIVSKSRVCGNIKVVEPANKKGMEGPGGSVTGHHGIGNE